ncbi:MAG: LTA synthase family protein, partial [Clostridia bacterium]|nr:LTA synthase family protein [Clostridia bacterium]
FLVTDGCKAGDFLKFFAAALAIGFLFELSIAVLNRTVTFEGAAPSKRKKTVIAVKIIILVIFILGAAAYTGTMWGRDTFGNVTGDQLIINLTSPTEGTESSVYTSGFEGPVFKTLLYSSLFGLFLFEPFSVFYNRRGKHIKIFGELPKRIICLAMAVVGLFQGVTFGIYQFHLEEVFDSYVLRSSIIDENYVDPATANVKWPAKKRNLIHIYLESMENTFMSVNEGGQLTENLIPNLTEYGMKGVVFSDTDLYFGGPDASVGTQWSIASMVNQLTGLPMKAPGLANSYGADGRFLPGAYTLGEMLEKQGYNETVMIGASASFGGLKYLFENHGNWKIMDYKYALKNGLVPSGYKVWWGFEDDKLYKFAKDELTRLGSAGKPFNFVMETADTHRPGGYISPGKKKPYKEDYANALWNSDRDVAAFIEWIKKQPFYENTTIVLIGDHLTMDTEFIAQRNIPENAHRTQYNCILNASPSVGRPDKRITKNRKWSNWDMMPTVLAALGGD